jgi:hypothetical protein
MRKHEAFDVDRAPQPRVGHGRGGWQFFARLLVWAMRNSAPA